MAKDSPFDTDLVRELAKLLAETDLTEIEVEKGDLRIRVARSSRRRVTVPVAAPAPAPRLRQPRRCRRRGGAGPARRRVAPRRTIRAR